MRSIYDYFVGAHGDVPLHVAKIKYVLASLASDGHLYNN